MSTELVTFAVAVLSLLVAISAFALDDNKSSRLRHTLGLFFFALAAVLGFIGISSLMSNGNLLSRSPIESPDMDEPTETNNEAPAAISQHTTNEPVATNTPEGAVTEALQVKGSTATYGPLRTGLYIQAGDTVHISYVSGNWWIGQELSVDEWVAQDPTDANGYTGRTGERVKAQLGRDNPDECRPLLSAPFGSLIGSIEEDGALFFIGNDLVFEAEDTGILYLRINYYDHAQVSSCPYGGGFDNENGAIGIRVTITP